MVVSFLKVEKNYYSEDSKNRRTDKASIHHEFQVDMDTIHVALSDKVGETQPGETPR